MSLQEELEDVDLHEQNRHHHGVADVSKALVLLHSKAQDPKGPSHHAHAAVGPGLQVKALAQPRIQLHACTLTEHSVPCYSWRNRWAGGLIF